MTIDSNVFSITHEVAASPKQVWQAWAQPEQFAQWFGPRGFSGEIKAFDLRPGGMLHSCLKTPDGIAIWAKLVYRTVEPESHLEWMHSFSDEHANVVPHFAQDVWPLELLTHLYLQELGPNKTAMVLTWQPYNASPAEQKVFNDSFESMTMGWQGTFERLDEFLAQLVS